MQQMSKELNFLALAAILTAHVVCGASALHAQTADSLGKLDNGGRVALIRAAFEQRRERMNNSDITSTTRVANYSFHDGALGKRVIGNASLYQFHLLRLRGSHRLDTKWYLNEDPVPETTSTYNFIEKDGLERCFGTHRNVPEVDGSIKSAHNNSFLMLSRAFYLLDGSFVYDTTVCDERSFLFASLVKAADKWNVEIDPARNLAVITHPYEYPLQIRKGPSGVRKVYCDISKGFLPTQIEVDWTDDKLAKGAWREERTILDRCVLVDGLWMPMRIEERIRSGVMGRDICSVMLTEITDVKLGKTKEEDIEFAFPPNTNVADITKGIYYTVGADGQPINAAQIGSIPPAGHKGSLPPTRSPERRWPAVVVAVLLACSISVFVVRRRWKRK